MSAETETEIGFAQLGLAKLLKQYQLAVPENQREYAWGDKEVQTLFQDFSREIDGPHSAYFLGTVVTIPRLGGHLEVVDGQQRLATTAILLSAIRDHLRQSEHDLSESIDNEFLSVYDRNERIRKPRLRLNLDDDDYFRKKVQQPADTPTAIKPSHKLLESAFAEAKKKVSDIVSDLEESEHGNELNRWVDFLEDRAVVILLRVPSANNAYRMFETLNDRGKRVSQSDLVKNYLFGQSTNRLREVQQKWVYMRGTLESMEDDDITIDFLRHSLTAIRGLVRKAEIYDAVQSHAHSEQSVVTFMAKLESLAQTFVAIHDREHERWNRCSESMRRNLGVLDQLNIHPMRPLLLAVAHKFDLVDLEKTYAFCVSLGVRLMIVRTTRTGAVEEGLASAANHVYLGRIPSFDTLKRTLVGITPSNARFRQSFQYSSISNQKIARYYLRNLEAHHNEGSQPWYTLNDDSSSINLEHILPKRPKDSWPQFNGDEVTLYKNRIGNLTLMRASDNSDLQSDEFESKKLVYAKSPYEITKELASIAQWTADEIASRQSRLAEVALRAWPI